MIKYVVTVPLRLDGRPATGENPNVVSSHETEAERDEQYALLSLDPSHFVFALDVNEETGAARAWTYSEAYLAELREQYTTEEDRALGGRGYGS